MSFLGDLSPAAGLAASAANLGMNAAAMGGQQNYYGNIAALGGQNQAALDNAYGPAGFGGDTARYAAIGADYGRAVPGEIYGGGGGGGGGYPSGTVTSGGGMPGVQLDPTPGVGGGAGYWQSNPSGDGSYWVGASNNGDPPASGGWTNNGVSFDPYGNPIIGGAAQQQQPAVDWNAYFNGLTAPSLGGGAGETGGALSSGGGGSVYGAQPFPNPGYTPGYSATQNGTGYPGGSISQMFDPSTYGSYGMGVPAGGWTAGGMSFDAYGNPIMAGGGDPSYFDAGKKGSDYNPFGAINSGQVGQYDPYGGYQPPASFDQRYGQIPGQPYGQGYFDNTFGSVGGKSAYNPLAGGGYPGPMASDFMNDPARMQAIRDLNDVLRTIDNSGEDSGWLTGGSVTGDPGQHTLRPSDLAQPFSYGGGGGG